VAGAHREEAAGSRGTARPRGPGAADGSPATQGELRPGEPRILAVAGPTASGKSALAHAVARAVGGEIIVADPFQRYRGFEIAADSPRPHERAEVPYHLVGDLDLSESSRVGDFARRAHHVIDEVIRRGRLPIVSGGSGLYLRAALGTLDFAEPVPAELRAWAEELVARDLEAAVERLRQLDPLAAARVDVANPRRVARALELAEAGRQAARPSGPLWSAATRRPTLIVAISRPRAVLRERIAQRVRRELEEGLVAELEAALDRPGGLSREAAQIIGIHEVLALRRGELDPSDLEAALVARTRRLARKQLTWLRKMPGLVWLDLGDRPAEEARDEVLALLAGPARSRRFD
jgi:tRNA dimethylallyltransferase